MDRYSSFDFLLSLNRDVPFDCYDKIEKISEKVYAIANSPIPEHEIVCYIPEKYKSQVSFDRAVIKIHIIWLESNSASSFSGLVLDKADLKLYFFKFERGYDNDMCAFVPATTESILNKAESHNCYLRRVVDIYSRDPRELLDFQIYSPFTNRFFYIELPFEDRVSVCGIGLNDTSFWAVGWLGKLITKDFYVSYAECTIDAYEQLKSKYHSLYERAKYMEKNRNYFFYYNVINDKRKKYPYLFNILSKWQKDPKSTREICILGSEKWGINMTEYTGYAYRWMEDFLIACIKYFHGIS